MTTPQLKTVNAAVFIDTENFFGGYKSPLVEAGMLGRMRDAIVVGVERLGLECRITVSRAYANWSDPRINQLLQEATRLGIDTIQVQGVSDRNASDIHMAVDALAAAFERPIEVIVLVSSDGGFVPLVRQLRAMGRTVVGAGPKGSSPRLRAVCSYFISTDQPAPAPKTASHSAASNSPTGVRSPVVLDLAGAVSRVLDRLRAAGELPVSLSALSPMVRTEVGCAPGLSIDPTRPSRSLKQVLAEVLDTSNYEIRESPELGPTVDVAGGEVLVTLGSASRSYLSAGRPTEPGPDPDWSDDPETTWMRNSPIIG